MFAQTRDFSAIWTGESDPGKKWADLKKFPPPTENSWVKKLRRVEVERPLLLKKRIASTRKDLSSSAFRSELDTRGDWKAELSRSPRVHVSLG